MDAIECSFGEGEVFPKTLFHSHLNNDDGGQFLMYIIEGMKNTHALLLLVNQHNFFAIGLQEVLLRDYNIAEQFTRHF